MNKLKSYLQSTSRNMWSTVYYSRNELCLIRMGFYLILFLFILFFLLRVYIIVTCNLCQQIDGNGIHTSSSCTSENYLFYYIYIILFFGFFGFFLLGVGGGWG